MTVTADPPSPYDGPTFETLTELNLSVSFSDDSTDAVTGDTTSSPLTVRSATSDNEGVIATASGSNLLVTGRYKGFFETPLDFKTSFGEYKSVLQFDELPTGYDFLYKYEAPAADQKESHITVTFSNGSTYDYIIIVRFDRRWAAYEELIPAVAVGKF